MGISFNDKINEDYIPINVLQDQRLRLAKGIGEGEGIDEEREGWMMRHGVESNWWGRFEINPDYRMQQTPRPTVIDNTNKLNIETCEAVSSYMPPSL